jgi:hypothetical protein
MTGGATVRCMFSLYAVFRVYHSACSNLMTKEKDFVFLRRMRRLVRVELEALFFLLLFSCYPTEFASLFDVIILCLQVV